MKEIDFNHITFSRCVLAGKYLRSLIDHALPAVPEVFIGPKSKASENLDTIRTNYTTTEQLHGIIAAL